MAKEIDDDFIVLLDNGIDLVVIGDDFARIGEKRRRANALDKTGVLALDGHLWSLESGNLRLDLEQRRTPVEGVAVQVLAPTGWYGLRQDGAVVTETSEVIQQLPVTTSAMLDSLASAKGLLFTDGHTAWYGEDPKALSEVGLRPDTVHFLVHKDTFWGAQQQNSHYTFYKLDGTQQTATARIVCREPILLRDRAVLVPVEAGREVAEIDLPSGLVRSLEGVRQPFGVLLDWIGFCDQETRWILLAGLDSNEGRLVAIQLEGGRTISLPIPEDVPSHWKIAQWMLREERIFVGIRTQTSSWLLEYGPAQ